MKYISMLMGVCVLLSSVELRAEPIGVGEDVGSNASLSSAGIASTHHISVLSLNDGQKWAMDNHTSDVFLEMKNTFFSSDYKQLDDKSLKLKGVEIHKLLDKLIEGCTMTGAAHDQLHNLLMEYMPAVKSLVESGDGKDAQKIAHYLKHYDVYFK